MVGLQTPNSKCLSQYPLNKLLAHAGLGISDQESDIGSHAQGDRLRAPQSSLPIQVHAVRGEKLRQEMAGEAKD